MHIDQLLKTLQLVALPFCLEGQKKDLLESYSRLQVLSHVYLGLMHLCTNKSSSEALNLASEILVRLTFECELSALEFIKVVRLRDDKGKTLQHILLSDNGNLSNLQFNILSALSKVSRMKASISILETIFTVEVIERCCKVEKYYWKICQIMFGWMHKNSQSIHGKSIMKIVKEDSKFQDLNTKLPKNISQFLWSV